MRLRRVTGIACCRAANEDEGTAPGRSPASLIKQRRSITERPAEVEGRGRLRGYDMLVSTLKGQGLEYDEFVFAI